MQISFVSKKPAPNSLTLCGFNIRKDEGFIWAEQFVSGQSNIISLLTEGATVLEPLLGSISFFNDFPANLVVFRHDLEKAILGKLFRI